jgi:phosphoribosylpyrophosphate synthetase
MTIEIFNDALYRSLVKRPRYNRVKPCMYVSLRTWRADTKDVDLGRLKYIKSQCQHADIDYVAKEIAQVLKQTFGTLKQTCMTHPPRGASAEGKHFATEVCKRTAQLTRAEYFQAFQDRPRSGGSHPRTWDKRGDMVLITEPQKPLCIVIDDVSTTGQTLKECYTLLKKHAAVFLLAWLSGDTAP